PPNGRETLLLRDAPGRICPVDIHAQIASPPFPGSAMDGYAINAKPAADVRGRKFTVAGESAAGKPWTEAIGDDQCIRIFTGAAIPPGVRRVILQEDCTRQSDAMGITGDPDPRSNIRPAGHDIEAGERLVKAGRRLTPVDIGRLAIDGRASVEVYRPLRVGVFSTGDELVEPGTDGPLPWGSIYESNRKTLLAQLATLPVHATDLGILPDSAEATRQALARAAATEDFILTSGGVSVGDHDHVKGAVESLGALEFWKLNLKPGKPLAFGRIHQTWFCGLPGNPVSAIVTWLLIARPAILAASGAGIEPPLRIPARLIEAVQHKAGRAEYQRGTLSFDSLNDLPAVSIRGDQSSNRLSTFQDANCLVEIPKEVHDLPVGSPVVVLPISGM
ncbi:MAG: molybdopterin molybdotransferase MoeA, partial [Gammaproteobacteria bacterium]|nr:molybdopterin molybdotransferase MoeA [Gammaproteobacteria bacterium]